MILALAARMITRKMKLGSNELKLLFELEKQGKGVFSIEDAKRILETSPSSIWNVLYRLKQKGRIEELERGKFLLVPARAGYEGSWSETPLLLVSHLIEEYYVGFWTALNYWGMTEQVSRTIFVVTTKRKKPVQYGSTRFKFITISRTRFFGFAKEKVAEGTFNISSREKTIADCLMYPRYCGGLDEAVKAMWRAKDATDFVKLLEFCERLRVSSVIRRLAYVLEVLGIQDGVSSKIAANGFTGFIWLDPLGPKKVLQYSKRFGLLVNRTKAELTSWMSH